MPFAGGNVVVIAYPSLAVEGRRVVGGAKARRNIFAGAGSYLPRSPAREPHYASACPEHRPGGLHARLQRFAVPARLRYRGLPGGSGFQWRDSVKHLHAATVGGRHSQLPPYSRCDRRIAWLYAPGCDGWLESECEG